MGLTDLVFDPVSKLADFEILSPYKQLTVVLFKEPLLRCPWKRLNQVFDVFFWGHSYFDVYFWNHSAHQFNKSNRIYLTKENFTTLSIYDSLIM